MREIVFLFIGVDSMNGRADAYSANVEDDSLDDHLKSDRQESVRGECGEISHTQIPTLEGNEYFTIFRQSGRRDLVPLYAQVIYRTLFKACDSMSML